MYNAKLIKNTEKIDAKLRIKQEYNPWFLILKGTVKEWISKLY